MEATEAACFSAVTPARRTAAAMVMRVAARLDKLIRGIVISGRKRDGSARMELSAEVTHHDAQNSAESAGICGR